MADAVRITDVEAAILRAWVGGAQPVDIARARHIDQGEVLRTITNLCDLNRDTARRLLVGESPRPPRARRTPAPKVTPVPAAAPQEPATRLLPVRPRRTVPADLVQADRIQQAAIDHSAVELERWNAWRCPACRWVGVAGAHPRGCTGEPAPVALIVVPREADW